jgi:hypothetical protein
LAFTFDALGNYNGALTSSACSNGELVIPSAAYFIAPVVQTNIKTKLSAYFGENNFKKVKDDFKMADTKLS